MSMLSFGPVALGATHAGRSIPLTFSLCHLHRPKNPLFDRRSESPMLWLFFRSIRRGREMGTGNDTRGWVGSSQNNLEHTKKLLSQNPGIIHN